MSTKWNAVQVYLLLDVFCMHPRYLVVRWVGDVEETAISHGRHGKAAGGILLGVERFGE